MNGENGQRLDWINGRLRDMMLHRLPEPGDYHTAVEGLVMYRRDEINKAENCFYRPIIALVLQGRKRSIIGSEEYRYGSNHCLINGVDIPSLSYVIEADADSPFLVITLNIDSQLTGLLAGQLPPLEPGRRAVKGMAVSAADPAILGAFLRLAELEEKPETIPPLAPLIIREIHLRLLTGPQGGLLRAINTAGTLSNQVFRAINWLRSNYVSPLEVDGLAREVNMSPASFRKHFKEVTTMSPSQYHKRLRLFEAQRLMLEEKQDAASASYAVGYESPSHFSREYRRLFGDPPQRDVSRLRRQAFV